MDPVAAGLRADVVHRVTGARRGPFHEGACFRNPEAQHVDERVTRIRFLERDLSADGRNADAVAVAADPGDDAFDDASSASTVRSVQRTESKRVQQRNGSRPHREDVADDSADAGRGTLVGLDERRMVVRLDLEYRGQPVPDVDGAGVLARPLQDARAARRELPQVNPRALVAAVLRPHHRENSELGQRRFALERSDDPVVLVPREAVPVQRCLIDRHAPRTAPSPDSAATTDWSMTRPSALPSGPSHARSGCGMRPTILRASLQMPAMLLTDPFGFAASVASPRSSQ